MNADPGHTPDDLPPGLLEEYLKSARAQVSSLAEIADRLVAAPRDIRVLDALRRETHKVHGSAGSYGFWDASRLAADMEATVKTWLADPGAGGAEERGAAARRFVTSLAAALRLR